MLRPPLLIINEAAGGDHDGDGHDLGLDVFDTTVQDTHPLKDVIERICTYDRHSALPRRVPCCMRCATVSPGKCCASSGRSCRCSFAGFTMKAGTPQGTDKGTSRGPVSGAYRQELPRAEVGEVERGTRAVLDVLSKRIDRGAALDRLFPEELLNFWPASCRAARGRQQGATLRGLEWSKRRPAWEEPEGRRSDLRRRLLSAHPGHLLGGQAGRRITAVVGGRQHERQSLLPVTRDSRGEFQRRLTTTPARSTWCQKPTFRRQGLLPSAKRPGLRAGVCALR